MASKLTIACVATALLAIGGSAQEASLTASKGDAMGSGDYERCGSNQAQATEACNPMPDQRENADEEGEESYWCGLRDRALKKGRGVKNQLWGVNLTVGVNNIPPLVVVNETLPRGVGVGLMFAGPVVIEFERSARQHGVQVTYVAMPPIDRNSTTITDYLLEHAPQYDLLLGPFIRNQKRIDRGLLFSKEVVDYTLRLYMQRKDVELWLSDSVGALMQPFDASAWCGVLIVIGFPALCLCLMRGFHFAPDALVQSVLILCGVSGPLATWPLRNRAAGVFMLAWAMAVVPLRGLYQSAMQRALIPSDEVTDLNGFKGGLCVATNVYNERFVRPVYSGPLKGYPREDLPKEVVNGPCDGMVERAAFAQFMLLGAQPQTLPDEQGALPYGCQLKAVGRPIIQHSGCHVVHDGPCKLFIKKVVSSWVQSPSRISTMQQEIDSAMEDRCQRSPHALPDALLSKNLLLPATAYSLVAGSVVFSCLYF